MMTLRTEDVVAAPQPGGSARSLDSLGERLESLAAREPKRELYTFLHADGARTLTLQALDRRARAGARVLADARVQPGDRVLLLFPQGLDFIAAFMSCIYRGAIAVTAPFPSRPLARVLPRLRSIADDCRPALVLSSFTANDPIARDIVSQVAPLSSLPWLSFAEIPQQAEQRRVPVDGSTPAFLQYTSGSTAAPRGVVVTHQNLLANCRSMRHPRDSRILSWLPQYHDFGLICSLLLPLVVEVDSVILPPGSFLQNPLRWLEAISQYRATHSPAPNFAFEMCVRRITEEQRARLDLSCWRSAVVAAEPIRSDTLERFLAAFAPCGVPRTLFTPAYGLAEATLLVTRKEHEAELRRLDLADVTMPEGTFAAPSRSSLISCGAPAPESKVLIVDAASRAPCAEGSLGEIWIAGPSVASGYFGRTAETEATFRAFTRDGDGPFLRSGDLGVLRDGELFVAGRSKEVIVVRGVKYYPQDIEASAEQSHASVEPASAAAFGTALPGGEEGVVVVVELARSAQREGAITEIERAIASAVARDHGIALHAIQFVARGALPKTTSGKIRRVECRTRYEAGSLEALRAASPSNNTERPRTPEAASRWLTELSSLVPALLRRQTIPKVTAETLLCDIGLDSVMFAELGAELETRYGFKALASELFSLSLGELAHRLALHAQSPGAAIARREADTTTGARVPRGELHVEAPPPAPARARRPNGLQFSLFSFGDLGGSCAAAYELIIESACVADDLGFAAVWLPERHFHPFGGVSPNPTVLAAALSQKTKRLRLRAGSVILPLHNPIRVAEEWAVIDNLSGGRVDLAFGWGWNPNDFVLAPDRFARRKEITLSGIQTIQGLWRGGTARAENGAGMTREFQVFPRPHQAELPVWLTCTQNPEAFITAGAWGYNVLTALLFQSTEELATNIALYRAARAQNGHDPESGVVSLMLHTLLGSDRDSVREVVRAPFKSYLHSSRTLWQQHSRDIAALDERQREITLEHAFERYFETAALFGTPRSTLPLVSNLCRAGVTEIACLFDFGVEAPQVLASFEHIRELHRMAQTAPEVLVSHDQ